MSFDGASVLVTGALALLTVAGSRRAKPGSADDSRRRQERE
jgi:hypothetical protein